MELDTSTFNQKCIIDYLYQYAESEPDREAICNNEVSYSYSNLLGEVELCAKSLITNGIKKGDRVATLSPPNPDHFIIFLAVSAIGGIWVGLNPKYTREELGHVISDSEPSLIFTRTQIGGRDYRDDLFYFQENIPSIQSVVILGDDPGYSPAISYADFNHSIHTVSDEQLQSAREVVSNLDSVLLVYTSGTTGKPKGALLNHYGAIRHAHVQQLLRTSDDVRQINAYPINHIASVIACSIYCLVVGGFCYYLEKFDPGQLLKVIQDKRITTWGGVPIMLQSVLDHPDFSSVDLSSITEVSYSGGSSSKSLLERIKNEVSPAITTMYALTEAAGAITAIPATDNTDLLAETVGEPLPDCDFRLVDESGNDVQQGEQGEIIARGPFVMNGYWRLPEATNQAIDTEGWLHTKDVAYQREDGNIVLIGRLSDMYKSGGYNIYPREIEQVLEAHPVINLACLVGVPDPVYGEVGYAFVTLVQGNSIDEQELSDHCRSSLANYKVPKYFRVETTLPVLPNNKPDKKQLKQTAQRAVEAFAIPSDQLKAC